jgi:hypothetical protein
LDCKGKNYFSNKKENVCFLAHQHHQKGSMTQKAPSKHPSKHYF